jgi:two-component system nitrate/nitrite response regulator NarL
MEILFVDDHIPLCEMACDYIAKNAAKIWGGPIRARPAYTLDDAISAVCSESRPDLVFLDLNLDHDNRGLTTLKRFQEGNVHHVRVAVFTGLDLDTEDTIEIFRQCLRDFDAQGILPKDTPIPEMFVGIRRILEGEIWMPYKVVQRLAFTPSPRASSSKERLLGLSPRQRDVALWLARGLPDKEIARKLDLSPDYIRQKTSEIYDILDVKNRVQAALRLRTALEHDGSRREADLT